MQTGIIKWFSRRKGFVLIGPDSGCTDVLLHVADIEGATREDLKAGQRVQFEMIPNMARPEIGKLPPGTFPSWSR